MALSSCIFAPRVRGNVAYRIECPRVFCYTSRNLIAAQIHGNAAKSLKSELFGQQFSGRICSQPGPGKGSLQRSLVVSASWIAGSQIASSAFTLGTVAVLPFYTAMVVAPKSEFTKKVMGNSIPYLALGLLYGFLLYQSWTPETIRLIFANQYFLPELPGIAKMFSSEMTLASAWIHLLAIDLFAARQIYFDGLKNNFEMRHSITLCLLFCPIGVFVHFITRAITQRRVTSEPGIHHPLDN